MTGDTLVEEQLAVAPRTARHVLANPVGGAGRVLELLQVHAQVVEQGEAKHGAIGAVDKEGPGRGAAGHHTRHRRRRQAGYATLGVAHQYRRIAEIAATGFQEFIVAVVAAGIGGNARHGAAIEDVAVQQLAKVHLVAHHADDGGAVVVQRCEHVLGLISPGADPVFQGDRVEVTGGGHAGRAIDGVQGRLGGTAPAAYGRLHGIEHGIGGRHAGQAIVYAPGLLARPRLDDGRAEQANAYCYCKTVAHVP